MPSVLDRPMLRPPLALNSLRHGLELWNSSQNAAKLAKRAGQIISLWKKIRCLGSFAREHRGASSMRTMPASLRQDARNNAAEPPCPRDSSSPRWLVRRTKQTMLDGNHKVVTLRCARKESRFRICSAISVAAPMNAIYPVKLSITIIVDPVVDGRSDDVCKLSRRQLQRIDGAKSQSPLAKCVCRSMPSPAERFIIIASFPECVHGRLFAAFCSRKRARVARIDFPLPAGPMKIVLVPRSNPPPRMKSNADMPLESAPQSR